MEDIIIIHEGRGLTDAIILENNLFIFRTYNACLPLSATLPLKRIISKQNSLKLSKYKDFEMADDILIKSINFN